LEILMKNVFLGLFAAAVLSTGLFAVDAPAKAADLSLTSPSRVVAVRHPYRRVAVVRPRCPGSVGEFAETGWTDRCFWWTFQWQDYRHYRSYARAVRYSDVVSYRN
jgi:hypothetical protein